MVASRLGARHLAWLLLDVLHQCAASFDPKLSGGGSGSKLR